MRSIWAVATNTIKQALRMKIAAVFIILLLVLLPVMGVSTTGDYTLKGRLQTFVSYGLSLTNLLLCLLTLIVSIYSLTSDIDQRQIYTVLTKPIRRFQLLFGKLLGVILLSVALLVFFSALIYTITIYMPKFREVPEDQLVQADNEFFTARASLTPPKPNVTQEVLDTYKQLKEKGQLDQLFRGRSHREILAELAKRKQLEKRATVPGQQLVWKFDNVRPRDPNGSLFIRYKYDVSASGVQEVSGIWTVGDNRRYPPIFRTFPRRDTIQTFHELEVPAKLVANDGYLAVAFLNDPRVNYTVVFFPLEDGLEVLYKADTFTANFFRAVLLILFRLIFLACLGIFASAFLSFPVAILLCLAIFATATISGFIIESFDLLSEDIGGLYSYTFKPVIRLLPQFDRFNPNKFLVPARLLSWSLLAKAAGFMVCLKAVLLLLLGLLIFSFKEIAKIII